jgi:tripartite-type tricarboxylate transporter receptor subunit TctC
MPTLPARASTFAIVALLVIALFVLGLFGVAGLAGSRVLAASTFPDRAIKFIVPVPPGPLLDMLPRMLGEKLSARWGHPVIVENRPGAGTNLGAEAVARAEPDGHTLLAAPPAPLVLSQWSGVKLGFDPTAFVPVTVMVEVPSILVVHPKVPVASFAQWIAYAKANPAAMNYGSPGMNTTAHLAQEELMRALGVHLVHVPYQGMGPAINDLVAGHIQTMFAAVGTALPHIEEGRLRAIALTGGERLARLPGIPVMSETIPGFNHVEWFAVVAPPRTPAAVVESISQAIAEALRAPDVGDRLERASLVTIGNKPAEAAAFIAGERERWRAIVEARRDQPR